MPVWLYCLLSFSVGLAIGALLLREAQLRTRSTQRPGYVRLDASTTSRSTATKVVPMNGQSWVGGRAVSSSPSEPGSP